MTADELLAELKTAPCPETWVWNCNKTNTIDKSIGWICDPKRHHIWQLVEPIQRAMSGGNRRLCDVLPDAITEAIEYLERQVAIEGCEHVRLWPTSSGGECLDCGAEWHGGKWT